MRLVNVVTGDVRPVPCRRLVCPVCIRRAAWRRSLAIADARPERFLTFTQVGDNWQTIRGRMKRLRYDIADELGECEWVYSIERNPRGTGHHAQVWQHGDFLPQHRLVNLAERRGFGQVVDIRAWRTGGESYALKEAYAVKDAHSASYYLEMNGDRLTHQSRGFFDGGVRDAEKRAVARVRRESEDGDAWQVVSVSELDRAMPRPRPQP